MTKWLACIALLASILAVGCGKSEEAAAGDGGKVEPSKPIVKAGGQAEMGSAELKPGISAEEADKRVGSMSGGK